MQLKVRVSYCILPMAKCIPSLGNGTILSTMEASSSNCQVDIFEGDGDKLYSRFIMGYFSSSVCLYVFWIESALGTSQRAMHVILSPFQWHFVLACLDNIEILSKSPEVHNKQMHDVLTLLTDAGTTMSLKKCRFSSSTISYMSHLIHGEQLMVLQHTIYGTLDLSHLLILQTIILPAYAPASIV